MRASQLWRWIYHRGAREFSAMRNIARPVLDRLAERCTLARPDIVAEQLSADGARKWLLRLAPAHRFDKGAEIECFYIPGITATRPTLPLLRWRARHRPWACVPAWGATTRLRRRVIASRSASSPSGRPIDSLRRRAGRAGSSGSLVEKIGLPGRTAIHPSRRSAAASVNARSGRRPPLEARPAYLPTCAVRGRDLQQPFYVETRRSILPDECRLRVEPARSKRFS
jgi:hypothetical protein